jgi:hypothetical protein
MPAMPWRRRMAENSAFISMAGELPYQLLKLNEGVFCMVSA